MEEAASKVDHAPMEDAAPASMVEADAKELEVAGILSNLRRLMRSRDRQERRRERRERRRERQRERARAAFAAALSEIHTWTGRRPRSVPQDDNPSPAPAPAAAAAVPSPDTPLAYPQSGGDDAPPKDKGEAAAARPRDKCAEQQRGEAAASSGQAPKNARPLKVERTEQQDTPRAVPSRDLTEEDELLLAWAAAAEERYRQAVAAKQKAAASAAARRRRVEILRAKGRSLVSRRMRRAS